MSSQVASVRAQLGIRVSGFDAPKPVQSFEQCGFDSALMTVIKKSGCALQSTLLFVRMLAGAILI